jgi:DNA-binding IclR family transcriptional regulator
VSDVEGSNLRSVTRALRSLELIGEARELGVSELGRRLGVHTGTTVSQRLGYAQRRRTG